MSFGNGKLGTVVAAGALAAVGAWGLWSFGHAIPPAHQVDLQPEAKPAVLTAPPPNSTDASARPDASAAADLAVARSMSRAFQRVAKIAEPAVVHIESFRKVPEYERISPFRVRPTGRTNLQKAQLGSGAIVDRSGLVLTNNHVVAGADAWNVRLRDGRELKAELVGRDPLTDLAVLRVKGDNLPALSFVDSDSVEVGEWVLAIGSPFGFQNTVTTGIVSAKGRSDVRLPGMDEDAYQDFIQTDAAVNPGNSGGPLLDLDGRIIGVNSAIASRAGGSEGIGFAIPANMARAVMESLVKNGTVTRGYVGIALGDLTGPVAESLGVDPGSGVVVTGVTEESPAAKAGIKERDVIIRYQNRLMTQRSTLRAAIALTPPGTPVVLELLREGKPVKLTIETADYNTATGTVNLVEYGLAVRTLPREEAQRMGYRGVQGVVVTSVERGSLAERAGVEPDDIITQVDSGVVNSASAFQRLAQKGNLDNGVSLGVIRGTERGKIVVQR